MYHLSASTSKSEANITQPTRYAIRQVLDQELRKEKILRASLTRQARGNGSIVLPQMEDAPDNKENTQPRFGLKVEKAPKCDFFGRPIKTNSLPTPPPVGGQIDASTIAKSTALKGRALAKDQGQTDGDAGGRRIWVSFHEGSSNAVRKPITLRDLMDGF